MQLALRTATGRHPFLGSRYRGFRGMGDSNINPTTIWTPQGGYTSTAWGAPAPAVYVPPTLVPTPACISGPEPYSAECQQQLMAAQQQNLAAGSSANYAVDRANCESAWAANAAQYQTLGLPVPVNDCAQRTFGLTLPGSTGSTVTPIANAQQIFDPNYAGPGSSLAQPGSGTPARSPQLTFTNLTSGNNSSFKVGDRWQVSITGAAPNAPVSVRGGMNGAMATTAMGSTDGSGNFSLNGQMSQDQVGAWTEIWSVGGQDVKSFNFAVVPSGSVVTGGGAGTGTKGSTSTTQTQNFLGSSVSIGGTQIPVWGLGLAAVAVFFMMRGK